MAQKKHESEDDLTQDEIRLGDNETYDDWPVDKLQLKLIADLNMDPKGYTKAQMVDLLKSVDEDEGRPGIKICSIPLP